MKKQHIYQIDQSGKIEDTSKDTIIALSNGKDSWSIILPRQIKRLLQTIFRSQNKPDMFIYFTFASLLAMIFAKTKPISQILIDIEYPGNSDLIKAKIIEALETLHVTRIPDIRFGLVGKSSPAHELAAKIAHKKLSANQKITLEEIEEILWPQKKTGYSAINRTEGNLSQDWLPVGRKPSRSFDKQRILQKRKNVNKKDQVLYGCLRAEWLRLVGILPDLYKKIIPQTAYFPKVFLASLVAIFTFLTINLSPVHAQTVIDPSAWQTGATGLRTTSNSDQKTAGLTAAIRASGIPFMYLQGGVKDAGWWTIEGPSGIELGEIKPPGTVPSLTSESADWAHNQMAFTNNLNIWVSRLSPAILIQNLNNSLRLFSGNINGTVLVTDPNPPNGIFALNRPAPSYPKYVAFHANGNYQVQTLSGSPVNFTGIDQNWILIWYGDNSHFIDIKSPVNNAPAKDAYQADAPMLLKFQNNPTSVIHTSEGGIDLTFSTNSGYISMMPLFGREHLQASDTEGWGTSGILPTSVLTKINFWNTNNRLCSYPTNVSETYGYNTNTDTSTISENLTFLNVCPGGSNTSGFAILPPALALAKDAFGNSFSASGTLVDANYATEFGPIIGLDLNNTNTYSWSVTGLKKYTDSKRIITNPNGVPQELSQELNSEIQKIISAGHFRPWVFTDNMPRSTDRGEIFFLNPADNLYHLSEITGALTDSQLKTDLINYIKTERTSYPPETIANLPNSGTLRAPFATDSYSNWQNWRPDAFFKKAPLYNLFGLSRYYDLTNDPIASSSGVITAAKNILNSDMAEQDWASMSWFKGFETSHSAVVDNNRLLAGLVGFIKLAKAANDAQAENLSRPLLVKSAVARIAKAKYPQYIYDANLVKTPTDPAWMLKSVGGGLIYNSNWTGSFDDARQVAVMNQFGTYLHDNSGYMLDTAGLSDWWHVVNPYLTAYRDLVPETFRLLSDFDKKDIEIYLNKYTSYMPSWYAAYSEAVLGAEHNLSHPIDSFQIFLAKAFIQNDTPQNLDLYSSRSWLDSGDFFYMQKLAETIKAYQGWVWEDTIPCTLTSASWSTNTTTTGTNVTLNVTGDNYCAGKQVNFEVRRNGSTVDDIPAQIQPQPANIASGSATTSWVAEYTPLIPILTTPDYYFRATVVGGNTIESNPRLLNVTSSQGGGTPTPTPVPTASTDWPQVQKDPQRTGYSPEVLGTNIKVAWTYSFPPERVHPQVQAIIYQNKVFVGTEVGNMYAINAGSGVEAGQKAWVFKADGPIVSSVAAYDNKIFFGSLDGAIYALDVNTGQQVWKQQLSNDQGFSTAPVVAENKIMLGGRNGYFYALDLNNGSIIWRYNVGVPILQIAAFNNGKVYFGAMDMRVYALNTSPANVNDPNTVLAWKSQRLEGSAFKDYWPVVSQGKVYIIPNSRVIGPGIAPGAPFIECRDINTCGSWTIANSQAIATGRAYLLPEIVNSQNNIMSSYQANPSGFTKNMYILDENSGQEAMVVPQWSTQTHSGTTAPPCVDREGKLIVPLMFMISGWGRLDQELGRITDILYDGLNTNGQTYVSAGGIPAGFGNQDENYTVSCSNNFILSRHIGEAIAGAGYTGVFNLDTRRWTGIGTERIMPRQMGTNTQGGGTNPFSISNGMIYDIVTHELVARSTN